MKSAAVLILCLLWNTAFGEIAAESLARDFREQFIHHVSEAGVPGAAFAIVSSEDVFHIETHGQRRLDAPQPVDQDTIFRVASVSKTFAAGLAAMLVNEGKLHWDQPITQYKPDFRIQGDTHAIKIKHIVGQSSGIIPHAYDNLIEAGQQPADIYKRFRELAPMCRPGQCYSYQNSLFSLVEHAVETAAGKPYQSALREKVFEPLKMETASVGHQAYLNSNNRAEPHRRRYGQWYRAQVNPNYYRIPSAAGVNASIKDMAHWLQAQLGGRPSVLAPGLVAELTRPRVQTKREFGRRHWRDMLTDAHYGLGWRIYSLGNEEIVYHGGWVAGFRADVAYSKSKDIGLAIVLNAESSVINRLSTIFWDMVLNGD